MELVFLFLILPVVVSLVSAYFISLFTRNRLAKMANKNVKLISVITFIGTFLLIITAIFALLAYNIEIGR